MSHGRAFRYLPRGQPMSEENSAIGMKENTPTTKHIVMVMGCQNGQNLPTPLIRIRRQMSRSRIKTGRRQRNGWSWWMRVQTVRIRKHIFTGWQMKMRMRRSVRYWKQENRRRPAEEIQILLLLLWRPAAVQTVKRPGMRLFI